MNHKKWITVVGAREHNLKNITVAIPKESLTIITGPSGSGKSSLALDVLYAEGQRRYMESLSSYARQFLGIPKKPDFDRIDGLSPSIAIDQKTVGSNPRSTVGTITEIYDYLRILYARIGIIHCPQCATVVQTCSLEQITHIIWQTYTENTITILAPVVRQKKGEFTEFIKNLFKRGYYRFIIDKQPYKFSSLEEINDLKLAKTHKHSIDIIIDEITIPPLDQNLTPEKTDEEKIQLTEAVTRASDLTQGFCKIESQGKEYFYSTQRICLTCETSFAELETRMFSFNSPLGACPECEGLGKIALFGLETNHDENDNFETGYSLTCQSCQGKRLNKMALAVTIQNNNLHYVGQLPIKDCLAYFTTLKLNDYEKILVERLMGEIINRLRFLVDVGLGYLSLNRSARTLSGGEGQRIRLARQLGSALSGILYILDEPSIGLHQRDNDKLIETLHHLKNQGNTVVVVEHDHDTIKSAEYVVDMGPAAGVLGGSVVACGTPLEITNNPESLTGAYLSGKKTVKKQETLRKPQQFITLHNASSNNLKNITVQIPLDVLCCISGVSGSGKSSLIIEELVPSLQYALKHKRAQLERESTNNTISGFENLDYLVVINQNPIGRTPRSNPATYLGIFDGIRKLFASLPESIARGYKIGHFSFNVDGGRCETCRGDGFLTISMHLLPDVSIPCKQCKGKRYSLQTLEITYKNKNIADVLNMTAYEARNFFSAHKSLVNLLNLMCDVGLDYVALGQPSTTLSGGEAQRIKLVNELCKRGRKTLYILDEPTTGLHTHDIAKLLEVFNRLINLGNSMVIIEHNLDVLKTADYIIDLGPEGGDAGGTIIASGSPQEIIRCLASHTGHYLKKVIC